MRLMERRRVICMVMDDDDVDVRITMSLSVVVTLGQIFNVPNNRFVLSRLTHTKSSVLLAVAAAAPPNVVQINNRKHTRVAMATHIEAVKQKCSHLSDKRRRRNSNGLSAKSTHKRRPFNKVNFVN